jgi:hypothetical protein
MGIVAQVTVTRIISGGQTGADRGALEAAWDLGIATGGFAPAGWRAEDGVIPERYRVGMVQSGSPAYPVRTRANIEASDATLILSVGPIEMDSGSYLTSKMARTLGKPCRHFARSDSRMWLDLSRAWIDEVQPRILNVAGPRESREPGVQAAVRAALVEILGGEWDPWDAL